MAAAYCKQGACAVGSSRVYPPVHATGYVRSFAKGFRRALLTARTNPIQIAEMSSVNGNGNATTVPFTPRISSRTTERKHHRVDRAAGLTEKQLNRVSSRRILLSLPYRADIGHRDQITDTLASVRKVKPAKILEELNASGEQGEHAHRRSGSSSDTLATRRP